MQINDASKMIFVHIPRTGGSWFTYSWNNDRSARYFWHGNGVLMNSKTHSKVEIGRHGRLSGIKKQLAVVDVNMEEFKVVTLVREPIDRIVSAWKWFSIVKETAKRHRWKSIDDMLDEYEGGAKRANYLPQTYWLEEQGAKFDHIFKFEDLLRGFKEIQKVFPLYKPKGKLRRTVQEIKLTNSQIKRIKKLYKDDIKYLEKYYEN